MYSDLDPFPNRLREAIQAMLREIPRGSHSSVKLRVVREDEFHKLGGTKNKKIVTLMGAGRAAACFAAEIVVCDRDHEAARLHNRLDGTTTEDWHEQMKTWKEELWDFFITGDARHYSGIEPNPNRG